MEQDARIRDKRTGLIYVDVVDNGDHFLATRPGQDFHTRIPRSSAVEVGRDAQDEPVAKSMPKNRAVIKDDQTKWDAIKARIQEQVRKIREQNKKDIENGGHEQRGE